MNRVTFGREEQTVDVICPAQYQLDQFNSVIFKVASITSVTHSTTTTDQLLIYCIHLPITMYC